MLQKWIEKVRSGEFLAEEELKALCDLVKEVLVEESNVQPVSSPVTVRERGVLRPGDTVFLARANVDPPALAGLRRHTRPVPRSAQAV